MKENLLSNLWHKDATRSVIASLISILIGLLAGAIVILIVGVSNPSLGIKSAWEGIQLVTLGIFSTGRNAAGTLTFGFNSASIGNMLFRAADSDGSVGCHRVQDRPVQHRRVRSVSCGDGGDAVHRAEHSDVVRTALDHLGVGVPRRHGRGCAVGNDSRYFEGVPEH